jgi:hypothetical protein
MHLAFKFEARCTCAEVIQTRAVFSVSKSYTNYIIVPILRSIDEFYESLSYQTIIIY